MIVAGGQLLNKTCCSRWAPAVTKNGLESSKQKQKKLPTFDWSVFRVFKEESTRKKEFGASVA